MTQFLFLVSGGSKIFSKISYYLEAAGQHVTERRGGAYHDAGPTFTSTSWIL